MTVDIPLFPLGTVLFPGGPLHLRIFEPRYLDMVSRCLREQSRFGVVAIKEGSEVGAATTFTVGTTGEIVDWRQEADGLLGITVGWARAVYARGDEPRGRRSLLRPRAAAHRRHAVRRWLRSSRRSPTCCASCCRSRTQYRGMTTAYDDAQWVSYRLAEILPLPLAREAGVARARPTPRRA